MTQRMAPYPGLRPFGENDRAIFFGREAQTVSVLALLVALATAKTVRISATV